MDNKNIKYALIGGAAVIIAALGVYFLAKSRVEEEDDAENDLDDQIYDI